MGSSREKIDLTGQKFGRLTALAPAQSIEGGNTWLCRCSCGRQLVVEEELLLNGRARGCGSRAAHPPHPTYVDGTSPEMLVAAKVARKNNTSGVPGVDWMAQKRRWRAAICFKGKRYYLGSFREFEDAVAARKQAEAELHDSFLREYAENAARQAGGETP